MVDRTAWIARLVIRANLLPRPKETLRAFGIAIDADYLRQTTIGLAIVVAVAAIGLGIETLRVDRLTTAATNREAAIAAHAPLRAAAKSIALDAARYQEFVRETQLFRRSGADAAVAVARIGNTMPPRVWLDALAHTNDGYDLSGGARDVDLLGTTIVALGRAVPNRPASLVSTQSDPDNYIRFSARIGDDAANVKHGSDVSR